MDYLNTEINNLLKELTTRTESAFRKKIMMLHVRFVYVGKTDFQMLGCQLHLNAFGGRAPSGPTVEIIAFPKGDVIGQRAGRGR